MSNCRPVRGDAALLLGGLLFLLPCALAAPPANFQNELVLSGLTGPTALTFLPDGRVLVLEKSGQIRLVDPQASPPTTSPYMTITDIESGGERGLLDITLDPDFANNGYFYVYYTNASTARNRIARFEHLGSTGDIATETLIWEDNEPWSSCCHYGGGLDFGPDGKLYLTTGEEFDGVQAQTLSRAGGKIHRMNADGSIPADNPFLATPGALATIWAYGLRNPFRARFDLPTGRLLIGEVGGNAADSWEDIHVGAAGANFGWPNCEGICADPTYSDPIFTYSHEGSGASVTGGVVYRGGQFPPAFVGAYFYGDYVRDWVRYLTFDPNGAVASDNAFDPDVGPVVAFEQGPDGALYFLILQAAGLDIISGELRRFVYDDGNAAPTILEASADITSGLAPLTVNFNGVADDPEMDPLTYRWDFGDGTEAFGAAVSHDYVANGLYLARLEVSDGTRRTTSDAIAIEVGNPPTATITAPLDGTTFRFGDVISYAGTASDPDETLDPNDFSWVVRFVRPESFHPALGPVGGGDGNFPIPAQGQGFSGDVRYEFILTVTDSDGLVATDSVFIEPDKVDLTFETVPAGIPVVIDGNAARPAPFVLDTLIHFEHIVTVPVETCVDGTRYVFVDWSDGGAAGHVITVPETAATYTATYVADGDCGCNRAIDLDGVDDLVTFPEIALPGDFTVEAWVRLAPGIGNRDGIVGNTARSQDINFFAGRARLFSPVGSGSGGGGNPSDRVIANTPATPDVWTHYAITRSGTDLSLYIDGVLDATGGWIGTFTIDRIGRPVAGFTEGQLDEVRIWDVARTSGEIAASWQDYINPGTPGLVAYWTFDDDPNGQVVADATLAANDGLLGETSAAEADDPLRTDPGAPLFSAAVCPQPPVLMLTAPLDGAVQAGDVVTVNWLAGGDLLPGDRVHLRLDGGDNGQGNGSYVAVDPNGSFAFEDIARGLHTLSATLARADGSPYNGPLAADAVAFALADASCVNRAVVFDGVDDVVALPEIVLSGDFTIEAWVWLDPGIGNADGLVSDGVGDQNLNFHDGRLRIYSTTGTGTAGGPNPNDRIIATTPAVAETWTHYALTREAGGLALYVDGALDASSTWTGDLTLRTAGPTLGGTLAGRIDALRIWSVARSAADVAAALDRAPDPNAVGLERHYRFDDDPNAQVLLDASPSAADAVRGLDGGAAADDPALAASTAPLNLLFDADGDGVLDACDLCPGTAGGTEVGPFGCPLPFGDCTGDGLVDADDTAFFAACMAGPTVVPPDGCACGDLTADGFVDLHDFALLQRQ